MRGPGPGGPGLTIVIQGGKSRLGGGSRRTGSPVQTLCCSGSTENPGESFQTEVGPSVWSKCALEPLRPPAPDHPGFPLCRTAYFFLAARPRPAGAARNEMPVRIAFC
jgi:hypothetical protein